MVAYLFGYLLVRLVECKAAEVEIEFKLHVKVTFAVRKHDEQRRVVGRRVRAVAIVNVDARILVPQYSLTTVQLHPHIGLLNVFHGECLPERVFVYDNIVLAHRCIPKVERGRGHVFERCNL